MRARLRKIFLKRNIVSRTAVEVITNGPLNPFVLR